jgi:hypothetical protein
MSKQSTKDALGNKNDINVDEFPKSEKSVLFTK